MPALPITGADGGLSGFAAQIVHAITCYPEDEQKIEELIANQVVGALLKEDSEELLLETVTNFPFFIKALHRAPRPEVVTQEATQAYGRSWAAGNILLTLLGATIHHPELSVSVTKAVCALSEYHRDGVTHGGGKVQAAQRTLWKAWSHYQSVAHFAALRFWLQESPASTPPTRRLCQARSAPEGSRPPS